MTKTRITRTYGPIHFEDLDPHRFEDLIRELIYDHKDWQTIEATGRSGNDAGFDIRAYEKAESVYPTEQDEDGEIEEKHPMEGNLWMIQGKREKEIGPKRVKSILEAVDSRNPPYGYILAASANFSKESYDVFRNTLRKKGVMEFYLWGKAEIEDMLHLPKNDRVLFTFFGVSLVSRRRSRSTEIRFAVTNKNKLYRKLGEEIGVHESILIRDSSDNKYPYKDEYKDFQDRPRWKEYIATELHPLGLVLNVSKHYAYIDAVKNEFDFSAATSLIHLESDSEEDQDKNRKDREEVEEFWEYLPRRNRGIYLQHGMVRYDKMLVIDERGDRLHKFPHIFVDFQGAQGPFSGYRTHIKQGHNMFDLQNVRRIRIFPKSFPAPKIGKVHTTREVTLDDWSLRVFKLSSDRLVALFDCDGKYSFLKVRDVISIAGTDEGRGSKSYIQITHKESIKAKDLQQGYVEWDIEQQIGRRPDPDEIVNIYEFRRTYEWKFDPKQSS